MTGQACKRCGTPKIRREHVVPANQYGPEETIRVWVYQCSCWSGQNTGSFPASPHQNYTAERAAKGFYSHAAATAPADDDDDIPDFNDPRFAGK